MPNTKTYPMIKKYFNIFFLIDLILPQTTQRATENKMLASTHAMLEIFCTISCFHSKNKRFILEANSLLYIFNICYLSVILEN